jgi:hypothetical protein
MVAYADWVGSDWLVAVIVTVCAVAMLAGAVYRPVALNVPTPSGAINHVTAVLLVFATVAVNCTVCPP